MGEEWERKERTSEKGFAYIIIIYLIYIIYYILYIIYYI